jgi:hypothetical protein
MTCHHVVTSRRNGRGSGALTTIPTTLAPWYKYGGGGKLALFTPQCLLLPPLPCLLRFTAGPRNREGAPPPSPSCTPAPLLTDVRHLHLHCRHCCSLSRTLLGEIGSPSASSPLFHHRRPSFSKFFLLCSFSFMLVCNYAMVIFLA